MAQFEMDAQTFKSVAKHILANSPAVTITIEGAVAKFSLTDPTGVSGSIIKLPIKGGETYCSPVCIDSKQFERVSQMASGTSTITTSDTEVKIANGTVSGCIPFIDEKSVFNGISTPLESVSKYDVGELKSAISDAHYAGTLARCKFDHLENEITILSEKNQFSIKRKVKAVSFNDKDFDNTYSLSYLHNALVGSDGQVSVESEKDKPIRFKFKAGEADVESIVCPIVVPDEPLPQEYKVGDD
jgi:hypothetical protein